MQYNLRTKLSISYVLITLLSVFLISIFANVLLDKQFRNYVIDKHEQRNENIVDLINQQYIENKGWNVISIENIGMNALEEGLIVKVKDKNDNVVWDAMLHNNGLCTQMLSHMAQNMMSRYPNWKGEFTQNKYILTDEALKEIGYVEIGYFGPYFFNDNDLAFINALNKMLLGVGIVSLAFSFIFGAIMAKRLSMPIARVINTTEMISKGFFKEKISEETKTKEIKQLIHSVNNLAETLEIQENLRKRLTGDVAHELRTPLATLQSHMEAMIDGIWKPDTQRLKSCHEELIRINKMVGELEKLARFENQGLVLERSWFDISELIQSTIYYLENEFSTRNIDLRFEPKKVMVYADKDKISQVLVNMISNAYKYTPESGKVEVNVNAHKETFEVMIKDNGIGISRDDLPYIFERFYRVDKSRNRQTGGSGIGLAIVKTIVEAHGGTILAKSEIDKGTEFTIRIPKPSEE